MFDVAVYQFTYIFPFLSTKFGKIKRRINSLIFLFCLRYVLHVTYDIFVLRFTKRMWNWIRCGSLLVYVVVDNQREKLR